MNRWTFHAGILSYALAVGVIVSVILSLLSIFIYSQYSVHLLLSRKIKCLDNLNIGMDVYLADPAWYDSLQDVKLDLYGHQTDSIEIAVKPWGIFQLVTIRSFIKQEAYSQTFLSGRELSQEAGSAIYLVDEGRSMSVAGNTRVEGTCYLPLAGVHSGFINMSYLRDQLIYGEEKRSKEELPHVSLKEILMDLETLKKNGFPISANGSFKYFFQDSIQVYEAKQVLVDQLAGHLFIYSDSGLEIDSLADLVDVVVFAPSIRFKSGFDGSGQFFATDTVIIEPRVRLKYPSVLAMYRELEPATIYINEKSTVDGWILIDGDNDSFRNRILYIEDGATISGMIYCNGMVEVYGQVFGNIATRRFLVNSTSGIYENYLFNAEINRAKLDSAFVTSPLWFGKNIGRILKYVE